MPKAKKIFEKNQVELINEEYEHNFLKIFKEVLAFNLLAKTNPLREEKKNNTFSHILGGLKGSV